MYIYIYMRDNMEPSTGVEVDDLEVYHMLLQDVSRARPVEYTGLRQRFRRLECSTIYPRPSLTIQRFCGVPEIHEDSRGPCSNYAPNRVTDGWINSSGTLFLNPHSMVVPNS